MLRRNSSQQQYIHTYFIQQAFIVWPSILRFWWKAKHSQKGLKHESIHKLSHWHTHESTSACFPRRRWLSLARGCCSDLLLASPEADDVCAAPVSGLAGRGDDGCSSSSPSAETATTEASSVSSSCPLVTNERHRRRDASTLIRAPPIQIFWLKLIINP